MTFALSLALLWLAVEAKKVSPFFRPSYPSRSAWPFHIVTQTLSQPNLTAPCWVDEITIAHPLPSSPSLGLLRHAHEALQWRGRPPGERGCTAGQVGTVQVHAELVVVVLLGLFDLIRDSPFGMEGSGRWPLEVGQWWTLYWRKCWTFTRRCPVLLSSSNLS